MTRSWIACLLALGIAAGSTACDALRVFFPSDDHDAVAPKLPPGLARPALLVFSKTNGFRHEESIPAGIELFRRIALRNGGAVFATENGAVHAAAQLARFDVVVWHNVSGNVLSDAQRAALRAWIEAGGGFVAVHGSGGDPSYDWQWYVDELIGAQFIGHPMGPQFQDARLVVEDRSHPATAGLPPSLVHNEEWYSFDASVRARPGFRVLASVDETSYAPVADWGIFETDLRMGEDHPVVWSHCVGRGRVFYSALGHQAKSYALPEIEGMLEGAVRWAARRAGEGCDEGGPR
jgi:type 1 glutamine amidotransferase